MCQSFRRADRQPSYRSIVKLQARTAWARLREVVLDGRLPFNASQSPDEFSRAETSCAASAIPSFFIARQGADDIAMAVWERLHSECAERAIGVRGYLPKGVLRADSDGRRRPSIRRYADGEGEGGSRWRDVANVGMSDGCVAFLNSSAGTGRGTMSVINAFLNGRHEFAPVAKPGESGFTVLDDLSPEISDVQPLLRRSSTSRLSSASRASEDSFMYSAKCPKHSAAVRFTRRPVLVFWDVSEDLVEEYAVVLRTFLQDAKPQNLMLAGPHEACCRVTAKLGAEIFSKALKHDVAMTTIEGECA